MAGMTKVSIDGVFYNVDDVTAVDYSEAQGLTSAQQGQARENIEAGALSNFAPAFVQATANAAGTYVTYTDGKIYYLPDGHAANATWANTTKSAVTVGGELNNLKSAFTNFGLCDITWEQGRLSSTGGLVNSNYAIRSAEYLPVMTGRKKIFVAGDAAVLPSGASAIGFLVFEYTGSGGTYAYSKKTEITNFGSVTFADDTTYWKIYIQFIAVGTYALVPSESYKFAVMYFVSELNSYLPAIIHPNANVGIYGTAPVITKSGTDYTVTVKGYLRTYYCGGIKLSNTNRDETFTLHHNDYLIYNPATDSISVSSGNLNGKIDAIPLLYNTNGALIGLWATYYTDAGFNTRLNNIEGIYFNGVVGIAGEDPIITRSGNDFTITINGYVRALWDNGWKISTTNRQDDIYTISTSGILVYYPDDDTFASLSTTSDATKHFIPVLFASYGKTFGQWARFYSDSDQLVIPAYYDTHLAAQSAAARSASLNVGKQGGRFIFFTDYHREDNEKHTGALIEKVMHMTGVYNVVFGGDAIQSETTAQAAFDELVKFKNDFAGAEELGKVYYIIGNHEYNNPSANPDYESRMLDGGTVMQLLNDKNGIQPLWNLTLNGYYKDVNSFFVDDEFAKVRYYFITCNYQSIIPNKDIRRICNSMLTIPEEYAVIFISHVGNTWSSDLGADVIDAKAAMLMDAGAALNDGTSVTIHYTESFSETYDYTGKARPFVGMISGHNHRDSVTVYDDRFPVISTTTDARILQSVHQPGTRSKGTINEQAFDVVQFDLDTNRIYLTRIGYGTDRIVSFGVNGAGLIN